MKKNALRALVAVALFSPLAALAQAAPPAPPQPPEPPMVRRLHGPPVMMGIPPHVAKEIGLSAEQQREVRRMSLEANEALINLEADLKRAQLQLEKLLEERSPNESAVLSQVEAVGRAEVAVRKNRLGLMLRIRRFLGPEMWEKLEAAMPMRHDRFIRRRGPRGERHEHRAPAEGAGPSAPERR